MFVRVKKSGNNHCDCEFFSGFIGPFPSSWNFQPIIDPLSISFHAGLHPISETSSIVEYKVKLPSDTKIREGFRDL